MTIHAEFITKSLEVPAEVAAKAGDFRVQVCSADGTIVSERKGPETQVDFLIDAPGDYYAKIARLDTDGNVIGDVINTNTVKISQAPIMVTINVPASGTLSVPA